MVGSAVKLGSPTSLSESSSSASCPAIPEGWLGDQTRLVRFSWGEGELLRPVEGIVGPVF